MGQRSFSTGTAAARHTTATCDSGRPHTGATCHPMSSTTTPTFSLGRAPEYVSQFYPDGCSNASYYVVLVRFFLSQRGFEDLFVLVFYSSISVYFRVYFSGVDAVVLGLTVPAADLQLHLSIYLYPPPPQSHTLRSVCVPRGSRIRFSTATPGGGFTRWSIPWWVRKRAIDSPHWTAAARAGRTCFPRTGGTGRRMHRAEPTTVQLLLRPTPQRPGCPRCPRCPRCPQRSYYQTHRRHRRHRRQRRQRRQRRRRRTPPSSVPVLLAPPILALRAVRWVRLSL